MSKATFHLISHFDMQTYRCGVKAGAVLRLRHDIAIRDHTGSATGKVLHAGGIWKVLPGAKQDPDAVRLEQPDGKLHTWGDDPTLFDAFEVVTGSDP